MVHFEKVQRRASERKGGDQGLSDLLPPLVSKEQLSQADENRCLAEMTRCIFQAGFSWKVIDQKWDGFEEVFQGFDINALLSLCDDDWDELCHDSRIVRNKQKIASVRANARFIEETAIKYGSFPAFIAAWPESDLIGLFDFLKKHGSRLGGNTGQRFLRNIGKDTFVLSKDVVTCLRNIAGLELKAIPTSKQALKSIQETFNQWHEETSLPYTHLSKIMAYSID